MQKARRSQQAVLFYSFSVALGTIILFIGMFRSPSASESSVLWGLSLPRLLIAIGLLAAFIFYLTIFWRSFLDRGWAEAILERWFGGGRFSRVTAWLAGIGLGLGWIGAFLPSYRTGMLAPYWGRVQPITVFLLVASLATLVVIAVTRNILSVRGLRTSDVFRLGLVLFLASLPVLGLSLWSKYDAYLLEDFWYGAAVPILASQLIVPILGGVLLLLFGRNMYSRRTDLIIFFMLYAVTAVLWAYEPLQKSFMFIGPYAPNKVLYPFADAANFDTASQFGLIGQGIIIFNTLFFERTLYLGFLIYLHSLFGQNYEVLMAAQAAIFAIFPALLYWIGRSLNMRAAGLATALIATIRGINSIAASNMTDTAGPKMILTDFPTAIGVALIILFLCEWLKQPRQKWHYAVWVGGAIGLTIMLRTNALIFLLFIPLYALLHMAQQWKNWLVASSLIVFAIVAITLPWELRNVSRGAMPYSPIVTKIQNVIRTRYPSPSGSVSPQERILSAVTLQQTLPISSLYTSHSAQEQACQTIVCFAPKHFLHNVITSILMLPTSPLLDDLHHTVRESNPYWRADWDGQFTASSLFFFTLNMFFVALGIGAAWKGQRLPGLAPLAVFVFYNLSNAFARTSGGRYLVPADWIVSFYFMIGVLYLIKETISVPNIKLDDASDPENTQRPLQRSSWGKALIGLFVLFGIGALVPLSESLNPPRYADFNTAQALQRHEAQLNSAGLTMSQVDAFLENPGSELLVGRTLYPRAYKMDQGEIIFYPYTVMGFPRTGFVLIGPKGADNVVLPGGIPEHFPHAEDALVLGCREQNYVDAVAVILLDGTETIYTRWPMSKLTCPLKQPVCRNNVVCE